MPDNIIQEMNDDVRKLFTAAVLLASSARHEYLTPEHILKALLGDPRFAEVCLVDEGHVLKEYITEMETMLTDYLQSLPAMEDTKDELDGLELSSQLIEALNKAGADALLQGRSPFNVCDLLYNIASLKDSVAAISLHHCLQQADLPLEALLEHMAEVYDVEWVLPDGDEDFLGDDNMADVGAHAGHDAAAKDNGWRNYVIPLENGLAERSPLVGREDELENMLQVLCRKQKNSVLLLGDSGVGKTKLVDGLSQAIAAGSPLVPESMRNVVIYRLNMGRLIAGAQYKGDFENRLTSVLDAMSQKPEYILFVDDIHDVAGKGGGDASMDVASVLLPYLDAGRVRVIGATTHEDFNRTLAQKRGLVRRFQTVEVQELSASDTEEVLARLIPGYEHFHGVTYDDSVPEFIVRMTMRHLKNRRLPDKALDLLDEAGAYVKMHPDDERRVTKEVAARVLARMAHVEALSVNDDDTQRLVSLKDRVTKQIFGQDEAVDSVVEAVQMAKAGLTDEEKPLASLLFVGPTGVGKTEVARVLAKELGVELVRFDMSEFAEKHTVAKFIGSPAGYVGYDDGGQLTDAVRKNPDCVLLFDEIEKAHSDIFDILLQVMDYGVLTDNKGQKTHFQNTVIIMTSNAGAQYARQAAVGFASTVTTGKAMLSQVKRTFKPEFINRLSGIVVFRDMDHDMASRILDKKMGELDRRLATRKVVLRVTARARKQLLSLGYSQEFGAREMDRVISRHVKSPLMREILFGALAQGGQAQLDYLKNGFVVKPVKR